MSDAIERAAAKVPDIKSILAAATLRETTAVICVAGELAAEAERLDAEITALDAAQRTSLADGGRRAELVQELDTVIALMREHEFEFRFQALPHRAYSDLLARHPSTDSDLIFNAQTFPVALVAASCISPVMELEQAEELFDTISQGGRDALWTAAWSANRGEVRIPTSRAASVTPSSSGER